MTTKGNKLLAKIDNNPKLEGPRMWLILPQELEGKWLDPIEDELDPDEELDSYTVRRLRGKKYIGNVEKVCEPFEYAELNLFISAFDVNVNIRKGFQLSSYNRHFLATRFKIVICRS